MNSSTPEPLVIGDTDLSRAWSRLFLHVLDNPGTEVSPCMGHSGVKWVYRGDAP